MRNGSSSHCRAQSPLSATRILEKTADERALARYTSVIALAAFVLSLALDALRPRLCGRRPYGENGNGAGQPIIINQTPLRDGGPGVVAAAASRDFGLSGFLESTKAANIPIYEHYGVKRSGEIELPGGGPTIYPMWRRPIQR